MFQNLYILRYRVGALGVQTGFLLASNSDKANEVGEAWCNQEPNRKFIGVTSAVIADESILAKDAPADSTEDVPVAVPVQRDQKRKAS